MALKMITPPTVEPLSLAELHQHLRIDTTDDDLILTSLIAQAREYCEAFQNKKYITQTLELVLDHFPFWYHRTDRMFWAGVSSQVIYPHTYLHRHDYIEFKQCSPVQSVTSVTYYDQNGLPNILDPSTYILDTDSFVARLALAYGKSWPDIQLQPVNAVRIRFVAGYGGTSASVPDTVKWAMALHARILFDDYNPGEKGKLEDARDSLLTMNRATPF